LDRFFSENKYVKNYNIDRRPPILHAAAVWLTYGRGFENVSAEVKDDDDDESAGASGISYTAANAAASKTPDQINTDRFHLVSFFVV
jgi:hypothetical protein